MINNFVCSIYPQTEFLNLLGKRDDDKEKDGRYLNSYFWDVKGYAKDVWMIAFNIWCDWEEYSKISSKEDIVISCLEKINSPVVRRRKSKVKRSLFRYGNLKPYKAFFKYSFNGNRQYISILCLTDERKNTRLWGEGEIVNS